VFDMRALTGSLCLMLGLACPSLHAAETLVAVASNFTGAMQEIAAAFTGATGHRARLSFGSSGKFYAQIRNGAPFEIFFSADQVKPAALEREGLTVTGSRFTYAVGSLVLWSADPHTVDADGEVLRNNAFQRLSIANPRLAPYGAAAMQVLQYLGQEQATRHKRVQGENIAQAYQFVLSGNAELGFVAQSQIMRDGEIIRGSAWRVPQELHTAIRQDVVLLKQGKDSEAALALLQFMRTPAVHAILQRFGYRSPESAQSS